MRKQTQICLRPAKCRSSASNGPCIKINAKDSCAGRATTCIQKNKKKVLVLLLLEVVRLQTWYWLLHLGHHHKLRNLMCFHFFFHIKRFPTTKPSIKHFVKNKKKHSGMYPALFVGWPNAALTGGVNNKGGGILKRKTKEQGNLYYIILLLQGENTSEKNSSLTKDILGPECLLGPPIHFK